MDKSERREGAGRVRRCIASGQTLPEIELLRFVACPGGWVLPDPAAKAPGRGVWVGASLAAVEQAIKKKAFARGFKREVKIAEDLIETIVLGLRRRCLDHLSFARKAGSIVLGNDMVRASLVTQKPAWRLEASDGAADGRKKLDGLCLAWGGVPTVGCFTGVEMGMALGRDVVVHAVLLPGRLADSWTADIRRLAGFVPLVPDDWPKDCP
ncbi:RNA-binding protein [Candidatus Phycosocius spiralis]|uniref:DNA-binding protein n=1 Tax=Candidatus Phycosocius spiralis TaxID=2815099 RepID=A0ABQ4PVL7_9PROT|nr:RNA-binding protein [Candidatus Phycosocius spiralis]GIU67011.1 DNA-binding protein [Candidatus Phycosocius spiralis]